VFQYLFGVSGVELVFYLQCPEDKIEWHMKVHIQIQLCEPGATERAKKNAYKRRETPGLYCVNLDQETQV